MTQFLNYAVPGVPFGCVFALMAVGLVLTYKASGVFNLAFGAQAFVSALAYVSLVQGGWPRWSADGHRRAGHRAGGRRPARPPALPADPHGVPPGQARPLARTAGGAAPGGAHHRRVDADDPAAGHRGQRPDGSTSTSGRCRSADSNCPSAPPRWWWWSASWSLFRFTPVGLEMRAVVESPRMTELAGDQCRTGERLRLDPLEHDGRPGRGAAGAAVLPARPPELHRAAGVGGGRGGHRPVRQPAAGPGGRTGPRRRPAGRSPATSRPG